MKTATILALVCVLTSCAGTRRQREALRTLTPVIEQPVPKPLPVELSPAARQVEALARLDLIPSP